MGSGARWPKQGLPYFAHLIFTPTPKRGEVSCRGSQSWAGGRNQTQHLNLYSPPSSPTVPTVSSPFHCCLMPPVSLTLSLAIPSAFFWLCLAWNQGKAAAGQ